MLTFKTNKKIKEPYEVIDFIRDIVRGINFGMKKGNGWAIEAGNKELKEENSESANKIVDMYETLDETLQNPDLTVDMKISYLISMVVSLSHSLGEEGYDVAPIKYNIYKCLEKEEEPIPEAPKTAGTENKVTPPWEQ